MAVQLSRILILWTLVVVTGIIYAAEVPQFNNGDRIVFIGDSITHGGDYHTQIVIFYATRFPQIHLESTNAGISGDSASGSVRRYEWDIAPHKANVATIMMGMNDVNRGLYAESKSGPQVEAQRQKSIADYLVNMEKIATLLTKDGTKIIFITPSLFDQTGNQKNDKLFGVNDALKKCAEGVQKLAVKYNAGVVDFNGPMDSINKAEQAKDQAFTIIGADRVHPGPTGHLVMAYIFLKAQGITPTVATMSIDAARSIVRKQDNCDISKLVVNDGEVAFDCLEKALPFPVAPSAKKAETLVPLVQDLNQEILVVSGLPDGRYELQIDSQLVFNGTASDFSNGVNLATIQNTPQYLQASKVQKILGERAGIINGKLRTIAQVKHNFLANLKKRTPEAEKNALEEKLKILRNSEGAYNKYFITVIGSYLILIPQKEILEGQAAELYKNAYKSNQPVIHHYLIRAERQTGYTIN